MHSHASTTTRRVMIWHGMELPTYPYLYGDVVATLMDGFGAAPNVSPLVYGHGTKRKDHAAYAGNLSLLQHGDVFIWIGYGFANADTPWVDLGRRGVRRIFYQCEPEHRCASRTVGRYQVDEMWDFAYHNFEPCELAPTPPRLRYVPLAATGLYGRPDVPMPTHGSGPLMFFGNVRDGPRRHRCYAELRRHLGSDVYHTYQAFDEEGFRRLLGQSAIWLNLHKACGDAHNPVTFRVPKLLHAGRLVLSERSHPKDEAQFRGLVEFHDNMSAIAQRFRELAARPREYTERAHLAAARFRHRFAPEAIFVRARIYSEVLGLNKAYPPSAVEAVMR